MIISKLERFTPELLIFEDSSSSPSVWYLFAIFEKLTPTLMRTFEYRKDSVSMKVKTPKSLMDARANDRVVISRGTCTDAQAYCLVGEPS